MEFYKFKKLENEDILLEKTIINKEEYEIITKDDGNILLKKKPKIIVNIYKNNIQELRKYNFTHSTILISKIKNEEMSKLAYQAILRKVYEKINDAIIIIKNTELNMKIFKKTNDGFQYLENLKISFQGVDSNKCLNEIINQCIKENISLQMQIQLTNNHIVNINLLKT